MGDVEMLVLTGVLSAVFFSVLGLSTKTTAKTHFPERAERVASKKPKRLCPPPETGTYRWKRSDSLPGDRDLRCSPALVQLRLGVTSTDVIGSPHRPHTVLPRAATRAQGSTPGFLPG